MSAPLPEAALRLFDGYDPAALAEPESRDFVIERLLEAGDRQDLGWVVETYGEAELARVFKAACGLSRRSHRFWRMVLEGRLDTEPPLHDEIWPL